HATNATSAAYALQHNGLAAVPVCGDVARIYDGDAASGSCSRALATHRQLERRALDAHAQPAALRCAATSSNTLRHNAAGSVAAGSLTPRDDGGARFRLDGTPTAIAADPALAAHRHIEL